VTAGPGTGGIAGRVGPVITAALVMAVVASSLHLPVFTEGALITPAGMHHALWPWRAMAPLTLGVGGSAGESPAARALVQENHTLSDLLFQVYPWQLHTARSLAAGVTPLWNPYAYTGVPFLANAQSAVFYPLHWPVWLIPSLRIFTLALLLKIVLAGVFMAVFLRGLGMGRAAATLGAVSFGLCGFMTSWLGYAHTNAAIWLPLLMHAARELARRPSAGPFLLMAAATGAQFLGGHPETSLHILAAAGIWFLACARAARRPRVSAAFFLGGGALGAAAAAVQLLPFASYLWRSAALAQRQALPGMDPSLPADALLTLLVPDRFGMPWNFSWQAPVPFQAIVGYAGAGVLLLAIVSLRWARATLFFQAMAVVSAVLVYGPAWVRAPLRWIPVVGITGHNRLLLLLGFSLAVLAAWTLQRLVEAAGGAGADAAAGSRERRRLLMWLAGTAGALVIAGAASGAGSTGAAAAVVAATALLAAMALLRPSGRAMHAGGIVALVALDLFLFAFRFNPHADPRRLFPPTPLTDFLRRDAVADMARGGRLMTVGWTMRPETQMVYRLQSIEGYDAMELRGYRRLLDRAGVDAIHRTGMIPGSSRPLLDRIGLRYIVTPPGGVVSGENMTLSYDAADGRVFTNAQALPRIFWTPRARAAVDDAAALETLASAAFDPRAEVLVSGVLPEDAGSGESGEAALPAVTLDRVTEGDMAIRVQGAARAGWLVLVDAWDPGWQARVNDRPEPVRRANLCFRAVRVPAGDSTVAMAYRPLPFRLGAWISGAALLCLLGVALVLSTPLDRGRRPPLL
jgi:hypothetical protein